MTALIKNIEKIMQQPDRLLTISENDSAGFAAEIMNEHNIGCLVVLDSQGSLTGVLSERDMLARVFVKSSSPENILVKNIMTANPISCDTDTPISKAEQLMTEHKIRHIPVVENGVPIGMISSRDVIAYHLHINEQMKIAAEQIAILSSKLRSWELEDIVTLAITEIPKNFGTGWALLYLNHPDFESPLIYRNGCPLADDILIDAKVKTSLSPNAQPVCSKLCTRCEESGAKMPELFIPLNFYQKPGNMSNSNTTGQGFLCMCSFDPAVLKSEELQLYKASLLQEILNSNLTNAHLYKKYRVMRHNSQIDSLTGVGSRRMLDKKFHVELARAKRYNRCLSVAIIDIDNFKQINDNFGHNVGDDILKSVAKIMVQGIRECDILARYGGDEFVILMPETKVNEAIICLERLRHNIKTSAMLKDRTLTVSCGVTESLQCPDDTPESILKRADTALYEAKRNGRNCVIADYPVASSTAK